MWLYRGAQSAVFYYAACTPCASSIDRRKRKREAARSRREKEKEEAIVTDQPRPFPQPTPFSTNAGWNVEIELGPGPPARRNRNTQRRADSWNTDGLSPEDSSVDLARSQRKDKLKHPLGDRWSRMRNQREDEPLWGEDVEVKGSSVGLSGRGKAEKNAPGKYHIARVPPVNDLHPPIVSGPKSKAETRWMLQPPPSARVMAGKERMNTSVRSPDYNGRRANQGRSGTEPAGPSQQLPPLSTQRHGQDTPSIYSAHNATDSEYDENHHRPQRLAWGRDESNFVIAESTVPSPSSSTLPSPTYSSPQHSLHSPDTPVSRPVSKATNDGGKPNVSRPPLSKSLTTVNRGSKKIDMFRVEINDPQEDVGLGRFEPIRPYRWSMDI